MNVKPRGDSLICFEISTNALMLQVQQHDLRAFVQLYCRMLPTIKRQAASEGWQDSAADDIAQEVFLRVWQNPDRFDGQRSAKAYLLGIARNVTREMRKAGAKTILAADQSLPDPPIENDPAAAIERAELLQALAAARSGLSDAQQLALRLVYEQKMRPRHVATQLGCTEDAIRLRVKAARRKLRQLLRGRLQLSMPGSVCGYVRRVPADTNVSAARQDPIHWVARWVAGMAAMSLILSLPPRVDHVREYQVPQKGSLPPIAQSLFSGEGAPSPPAQVELRD